jgi:hypothetical protein
VTLRRARTPAPATLRATLRTLRTPAPAGDTRTRSYEVLAGPAGRPGYQPGDAVVVVTAGSELDAAYQAGILLALGPNPAGRVRAWVIKAIRAEDEWWHVKGGDGGE